MPLTPFEANTALENAIASLENESDGDLKPQLDKAWWTIKTLWNSDWEKQSNDCGLSNWDW